MPVPCWYPALCQYCRMKAHCSLQKGSHSVSSGGRCETQVSYLLAAFFPSTTAWVNCLHWKGSEIYKVFVSMPRIKFGALTCFSAQWFVQGHILIAGELNKDSRSVCSAPCITLITGYFSAGWLMALGRCVWLTELWLLGLQKFISAECFNK